LAWLRSLIESLRFTKRGLVAVAAAVLAAAVAVLAVSTEDVTQHNGLSTTDPAHLRLFTDHRDAVLVHVAKVVTSLGAAPLLALLAVAAAGLLWWRGTPLVVAIAPGVALGLAGAVASLAKTVVGRARPPISVRLITETEPSFPSGHATNSAAVFVALALVIAVFALRRPIARLAAVVAGVALTAMIGVSRLVLGVHWPTDVLAGWALGTIAAISVVLVAAAISRVTPADTSSRSAPVARVLALLRADRSIGLRATYRRASLEQRPYAPI
jgi:undecaprenyl-diphosphatase